MDQTRNQTRGTEYAPNVVVERLNVPNFRSTPALDRMFQLAGDVLGEALGTKFGGHVPSDFGADAAFDIVQARLEAMRTAIRDAPALHWTYRASLHVLADELDEELCSLLVRAEWLQNDGPNRPEPVPKWKQS